jgi:hypothetical protein
MASASAQSYFEAHLRKTGVVPPPPRHEADKLITDRAAYIAFLEAQLTRVSASCAHVDAVADRLAATEATCRSQAAAMSEMREKVVSMTQLISMVQAYSERQGREAGSAVAGLHAGQQSTVARLDAHSTQLASMSVGLDAFAERQREYETQAGAAAEESVRLAGEVAYGVERMEAAAAEAASREELRVLTRTSSLLSTRVEAVEEMAAQTAAAADAAAEAASRAADTASSAEAVALTASDRAAGSEAAARGCEEGVSEAVRRAGDAAVLATACEATSRTAALAAIHAASSGGGTAVEHGLWSPSLAPSLASAAVSAGLSSLGAPLPSYYPLSPPPAAPSSAAALSSLAVTRAVSAAVSTLLAAASSEAAALSSHVLSRLTAVETDMAALSAAQEAAETRAVRAGDELAQEVSARITAEVEAAAMEAEAALGRDVEAAVGEAVQEKWTRVEGAVRDAMGRQAAAVGEALAPLRARMQALEAAAAERVQEPAAAPAVAPAPPVRESVMDDSLAGEGGRRGAAEEVRAALGAQLAELAGRVADADAEFRELLAALSARVDSLAAAPSPDARLAAALVSAEERWRGVQAATMRSCSAVVEQAAEMVRRSEGAASERRASLATGVSPARHGAASSRLGAPSYPSGGMDGLAAAAASLLLSPAPSPVRPPPSALEGRLNEVLSGLAALTHEVHAINTAAASAPRLPPSTRGAPVPSAPPSAAGRIPEEEEWEEEEGGGALDARELRSRARGLVVRPIGPPSVTGADGAFLPPLVEVRGPQVGRAPAPAPAALGEARVGAHVERREARAPAPAPAPVPEAPRGLAASHFLEDAEQRPGMRRSAAGGGLGGTARRPGGTARHLSGGAGETAHGEAESSGVGQPAARRSSRSSTSSSIASLGAMPSWYTERAAEVAARGGGGRRKAGSPPTGREEGGRTTPPGPHAIERASLASSADSTAVYVSGFQLGGGRRRKSGKDGSGT